MQPAATNERDRVGPYLLVKAIGAGGSARVDLARIERAYGFRRHVVIKRPLEHLRGDPRAAESLRREARLGARLRHPNLVEILDAGIHDGYDYLVLDYVHGGALRTLMQTDDASRVRDVPVEVALSIVRDVARGVHEAHELRDEHGSPLGLVHRDVSPGNVLVGLDGAVKLADFGIAKETRVATLSGSMHGTVTYMAPEQCRGHAFDRRADVFSLGVILYELVTGVRLFWADNDVASLHRVLGGVITRPRKIRPSIAPQLEDLVMSAIAHDQDRRLASARALAEAIEGFAIESGHVLAARGIARWAHDLLGPRDAPWIGTDTMIDALPALPAEVEEPEVDASLVALIESSPGEVLDPTFGPTDVAAYAASVPLPAPSQPVHPVRRRRFVLGGVLGIAVVIGVIAAVASSRDTTSAPAVQPRAAPTLEPLAQPAPEAPAHASDERAAEGPAAEESTDPPVDDEVADGEVVIDMSDVEPSASEPASPSRTRRRTQRARPGKARPAAEAGSAARGKSSPKVKWDPTMLLPTDPANRKPKR